MKMKRTDERGRLGRGTAPGLKTLRGNTVRSLWPGGYGLTVHCVSGLVVVTQTGDRKDHELRPGDEFRTSSRGLVVVWALTDSRFAVTTNAAADGPMKAA
jgi:hypothetical protein